MVEDQIRYGTCGRLSADVPSNAKELDIIKSRLCVSYIETLCSYLELDCSEPKSGNDRAGWDVKIEPVIMRDEWVAKPVLYIQLKGTVSPTIHDDHISYQLDRKTYDNLRKSCVKNNTLVAVMVFEDDTSQWVRTDDESLTMRRVMYWCRPDVSREISDSQESVTLHLPLKNILNEESLHRMIDILSRDEVFRNEL